MGGLEHPQISRSKYSNRAVTLIQQSAQNSSSLLIAQHSQNYTIFGLKCPQIQSPGSIFQKFPGGMPPESPQVAMLSTPNLFNLTPPMCQGMCWFYVHAFRETQLNLKIMYNFKISVNQITGSYNLLINWLGCPVQYHSSTISTWALLTILCVYMYLCHA